MLSIFFENLRRKSPLIHNITNYITANDIANILLASGASTIMADDVNEVEEITSLCDGLTINTGTLNDRRAESMFLAGKKAMNLKHKIVLDPVGAGSCEYRTRIIKDLVNEIKFDLIRGNISEIKSLATGAKNTEGVDADKNNLKMQSDLDEIIEIAKKYSWETKSIIVITGEIDILTDSKRVYLVKNGRREMKKITGTGCQLSALITAFISANQDYELEAAIAAVASMGIAGEIAWSLMNKGEGNASYRNRIIDAIYNMNGNILEKEARYEIR
ncbi:MAG: hydroxyethylthiazole kinase [Tissierellia bacterium]|nr:hydroxyethylthiazole kinase [Tissierellia bacterium]